jgi:hypothetical protein
VNEQSLRESNALLAAAAARTGVGELIPSTPAELAAEAGIDDRLAVARAVRALLARGRLEQEGDRYRLVDPRPLEPGERATVRRPSRRRAAARAETAEEQGLPTYEQVGRAIIERLIELSAEASELRSSVERARGEAEAARREALEAAREAARDRERAGDLEEEAAAVRRRLEMTEANLRSIVEAARSRPASPIESSDAQAILDVLSKRNASG